MSIYDFKPFVYPKAPREPRLSKSVQSSADNPLNIPQSQRNEGFIDAHNSMFSFNSSNNNSNSNKQQFSSRSAIQFGRQEMAPMSYDTSKRIYKPDSNNFSYDPLKLTSTYSQSNLTQYDPWGKPGAGAPIRGNRYAGSLRPESLNQPNLNDHKYQSAQNLSSYSNNNQNNLFSELEARQRNRGEQQKRKEPADFVSWINSLELPHLNNTNTNLNHTNVTREKVNAESIRCVPSDTSKLYSNDLASQAEESERRKKLEKIKHAIADEEHIKHYNSWWERQGGGAPTNNPRRRNLNNALISPRFAPDEIEAQQ